MGAGTTISWSLLGLRAFHLSLHEMFLKTSCEQMIDSMYWQLKIQHLSAYENWQLKNAGVDPKSVCIFRMIEKWLAISLFFG